MERDEEKIDEDRFYEEIKIILENAMKFLRPIDETTKKIIEKVNNLFCGTIL